MSHLSILTASTVKFCTTLPYLTLIFFQNLHPRKKLILYSQLPLTMLRISISTTPGKAGNCSEKLRRWYSWRPLRCMIAPFLLSAPVNAYLAKSQSHSTEEPAEVLRHFYSFRIFFINLCEKCKILFM